MPPCIPLFYFVTCIIIYVQTQYANDQLILLEGEFPMEDE